MKIRALHPWEVSPEEAVRIQEDLRGKIRFSPPRKKFRSVAAADVAYSRSENEAHAACLVCAAPTFP
jgi:deoxyribonuclease V